MRQRAGGRVYERVYLVSCDPDRGRLHDRRRAMFLLRAGVLVDLANLGIAQEVDGKVRLHASTALDDPVLVAVAAEIDGRSHSWRSWIRHGCKQTLALVEERLVAQNVVGDQQRVAETHARVRAMLAGDRPVEDLEPVDAALAVLAIVGAGPLVPRWYRLRNRSRYRELARRAGQIGPGIELTLRRLKRTIIAAQGGMG